MTQRIVTTLTIIVTALVFAIGAGAFTLSYDSLKATGQAGGVPQALGWLWPLLIDAPLVVFTLALLIAQLTRQSIKLWAGLVVLYTIATIGFNLVHAQQTPLGWTVAIVAPIGLLLTTEALRHQAKMVIERAVAVATLTDLTRQAESAAAALAALRSEHGGAAADSERIIADLNARRDALQGEIAELRRVKKAETATAPAQTSPDLYDAARRIMAERGPEITGSELGRLLGKSESLGRRLKRELTEATEDSTTPPSEPTGSAFDRIVSAAHESGRDDIADIMTTAKRGWQRVNGNGHQGAL